MLLVTGGAGFIGSVLVAGLEEARAPKVAILDWTEDPLTGQKKGRNIAKRGNLAFGGAARERLDDFLERDRRHIEAIFHMGAILESNHRHRRGITSSAPTSSCR